jgi:hypothetical protein
MRRQEELVMTISQEPRPESPVVYIRYLGCSRDLGIKII